MDTADVDLCSVLDSPYTDITIITATPYLSYILNSTQVRTLINIDDLVSKVYASTQILLTLSMRVIFDCSVVVVPFLWKFLHRVAILLKMSLSPKR